MPVVSLFRSQRLIASALTRFHHLVTVVPHTLLLGVFLLGVSQFSIFAKSAAAQTVQPIPDFSNPQLTDNQERLEEARQRLLNRGEFLQPDPAPQPNIPVTVTDSEALFDRYRLGPGDSIFAIVLRFNDLNFQTTLDLSGNVVLPLAGVVNLEGLTVLEAQQRIQAELNRYVVDPVVNLTLVTQRPVSVSVFGEVVRPGFYPLPDPQLSVAILSAGGATQFADLRSVRVRRSRVDGSLEERNVDLFTPLRDSTSLPQVQLEDGDAIIIPTLTVAASEDYDRSLVARSTLAQPQITIRVLSYSGNGTAAGGSGGIRSILLPNGSTFIDALTAIAPNPDTTNLREVALVRFEPAQGRAVTQEINARATIRGDVSQNPFLEDNDVIIVGRNFITRVTYALNTVTQPFRDVLGFLLFFETLSNSASDLFRPGGNNDN